MAQSTQMPHDAGTAAGAALPATPAFSPLYQQIKTLILQGLAEHMERKDGRVVLLVERWLSEAERTGHAPSPTDLAPLIGLSRQTVYNLMERFRRTLTRLADEDEEI